MARDVRWKVRFQSLKGINYEIHIYDSYTGTMPSTWPIELHPGETPIETSEDRNDDFFSPVRPSTGAIQVVDYDGTLMEQLIPDNGLSRPVRLIKKGATAAQDTIEWQGFLSCEAYEQQYTDRPQVLSININSVLIAMENEIFRTTDFSGIVYINKFIKIALSKMVNYGATFSNIYFPKVNYSLLNKYMNPIIMVEKKEQKLGDYISYIDDGKTLKEALSIICTFLGWCVRESGDSIIFTQMVNNSGDNLKVVWNNYATYSTNENFVPSATDVDIVSKNISSLVYRGNEHKKSIDQGAKSVAVTAKISKMFNEKIELPDYPGGTTYYKSYPLKGTGYVCARLCSNDSAYYGRISFMYYYGHGTRTTDRGYIETYDGRSDILRFIQDGFLTYGSLARVNGGLGTTVYVHTGACFVRYGYASSYSPEPAMNDEAIFVNLFPLRNDSLYWGFFLPIFSMSSVSNTVYNNGKFVIKANCDYYYLNYDYDAAMIEHYTYVYKCTEPEEKDTHQLKVFFRVGTQNGYKYWNGSGWSDTRDVFVLEIHGSGFGDQGEGYTIPVDEVMSGYAEFGIYPEVGDRGTRSDILIAMMMKSLSVQFEFNNGTINNEDSENNYYRLLGYNFKEEINVDTDFVTDRSNKISPSTMYNDSFGTSKVTAIDYVKSGNTTEQRISELDLLNRLAKFYSKIRRKLELICEHPTTAALPLLQISANTTDNPGYDGKLYIPMAESRDWQTDTSTLTLMETPDGDE